VQAAEGRGLNLGNLPGMSKTQKQATANALGKVGSAAVLSAMGYPNMAAQQAWSGVTGWVEGMMRDQAEKRLGVQKVSMPLSITVQNDADPYDYDRLRTGKKDNILQTIHPPNTDTGSTPWWNSMNKIQGLSYTTDPDTTPWCTTTSFHKEKVKGTSLATT